MGKHSKQSEKEIKRELNKKRKEEQKEEKERKKRQKAKEKKSKANEDEKKQKGFEYKEEKYKEKKKSKKPRKIKKVLLTILLIIIILASVLAYKVLKNGGGMKGIVTTIIGSNIEEIKNLDDIYVLCFGKSQNMTDTIMVVKYSPKTQQASILSIPRDSFVGTNTSNATAFDKINSKYQISPQKAIDAVNDLTGLNIKYYVTVDTKALRDLVDAIGGVYFDVPIDMDYDDSSQELEIHLKKGYQLLNGEQAEGVVRFRHNNNGTSYSTEYGDNDLGRMKTQRAFIEAVLKQTLKASNITKIDNIINIAKEEVQTNLSWNLIKNYIVSVMDFDTANLKTDMLPGTPGYYNGLSFVIIDKKQAKEKVNELFLTTSDTDSSENTTYVNNTITSDSANLKGQISKVKLEVLNGTASKTRYNEAITQLQNQGYKITKKGTTNITKKTVIIDRTNNVDDIDNAIKSLLCTGYVQNGENNSDVDYTIIIGTDY